MTCLERIEQYLKQQGVRYEVLHHACAFTAQRIAQAEHIPGKMQVKVVVLRADSQFLMAVLPAAADPDIFLFISAVQIPLYVLPALLQPIYRRLLGVAPGD